MEEAFESEERRSPYGSADDDEIYSLNLDTGTLRRPSRGKSLLDQERDAQGAEWRLQTETLLPMRKNTDEIKSIKRRSVRNFYLHQNEQIDEFVSAERVLAGGRSKQEEEEAAELAARQSKGVRVAIYGSFILNVLLFGAKVTAVVLSGSLSAIASAIDSFLDLLSGSIMFVTSFILRKSSRTIYLYPAGNSRVEPIAVILFASIMFVAAFQIIIRSVETIISLAETRVEMVSNTTATTAPSSSAAQAQAVTLAIFASTVVIKFFMWLYCIAYQNVSSSVHALATDHRSDVVFNIFALGFYLLGYYVWPYADPAGATLLAFYLMFNWYIEGREEVRKLSGQSAPPEFLSKITFLVWNSHPLIVAIDTCRAYHLASGFLVEVDIVLPHDMSLRQAHDIGQDLQDKIEQVDRVERCFVHLDWENDHVPEH